MSKTFAELEAEWKAIKKKLDATMVEYRLLRQKRSAFQVKLIFPRDSSPEAMRAFRDREKEVVSQLSIDLRDLDQDIKAVRIRLKQIRATLAVKQTQIYQLQAQSVWKKMIEKAEAINQLATQMEGEIKTLSAIAEDFYPPTEKWLPQHPELAQISATTIPRVFWKDNHLEVRDKAIDWDSEET
ncbi:hypothetical protein [Lyngbya sp. CCY1209]|uniref:hypothetical protein n=1 Tax=Lyngbya sp. CCY1209 TaxID=2886103 RepID=UPI002D209743|nr:hypothetical protein [Lyngbya sp. CCY1209]MEB3882210.1 hypothetical protein [Lyngbya sp. CCY1209]